MRMDRALPRRAPFDHGRSGGLRKRGIRDGGGAGSAGSSGTGGDGGGATAARARARSAGVSQSVHGGGVPGSTTGRWRMTTSPAITRRSGVGPRTSAVTERSAAVRHTPSRYWSRPPSSTTSTPSPASRARSSATRAGEEGEVPGEQGHDVRRHLGRPARSAATALRRGAAPGPAARRPGRAAADRRRSAPRRRRPRRARSRACAAADLQLRLGLAAQPRRLAAGQHDRGVRRHRLHGDTVDRKAWVPSSAWDE